MGFADSTCVHRNRIFSGSGKRTGMGQVWRDADHLLLATVCWFNMPVHSLTLQTQPMKRKSPSRKMTQVCATERSPVSREVRGLDLLFGSGCSFGPSFSEERCKMKSLNTVLNHKTHVHFLQWPWRQTGDSYKLQRKIHHSPMEGKRQLCKRDFGKRLSLDSSLVVSANIHWPLYVFWLQIRYSLTVISWTPSS